MNLTKFLEARKLFKIIEASDDILEFKRNNIGGFKEIDDGDPNGCIIKLLQANSKIAANFLKWVAEQRNIAQKEFNEI